MVAPNKTFLPVMVLSTLVMFGIVFPFGGFMAGPAYGRATTGHVVLNLPVSFVATSECTPTEDIQFDGFVNLVFGFTDDANGGFHINDPGHSNLHGVKGVGLTTGHNYIFADANNGINNVRQDAPNEFTFLAHGRLISQGNEGNQLGTFQMHVTINANGQVTAQFESTTLECKG